MAIAFKELLKDVENANRTGFKEGKGWVPHKSAEGGTRTVAYGHKLSAKEEKGDFVTLPNGEIVEFGERGLTEEEAEMLLEADIRASRQLAEKQWNQSQDQEFSSLDIVHQNLLSEIAFNIGTLKNSKGKFGWPSLAKGIKNEDTEVIKNELMRSFTDEDGNRKQLTRRVNKIREYVDSPDVDAGIMMPDAPEPQNRFEELATGFLENINAYISKNVQRPQSGSQPSSEESMAADEEESQFTEQEQALIDASLNYTEETEDAKPADETEFTPAEIRLIERATGMPVEKGEEEVKRKAQGTVETEEPVRVESTGERDDSKDPIYGIF